MNKLQKILAGKVLLILLFAGALGFINAKTDVNLGLDLKGGTQLDYKIDLAKVEEADRTQIIEGVREVIRKRVDSLGVAEPNIYVSNIADEYHVVVELAGISNIEEAKAVVGKTIQLEFKEENEEVSDEQKTIAKEGSSKFYSALLAGGDFEELGTADENANPGRVLWFPQPLQEISKYSEEMQKAIEGKSVGTTLAPFEIKDGYTQDSQGNFIALDGYAVVQILERGTSEIEKNTVASASARHILIAYEGSERSTATRTKEEAQALAEEVLAKINDGESVEDLASQYSDDAGSKDKGGDLGKFESGVMTPKFEEAAFALEVGATSEIVETDFGFHIIETYAKENAVTTKETVDTYRINKIVYITTPDPWKSTELTGEHFKHADVMFNQAYQPYVAIEFNDEGAKLFEEITARNIGKQVAIFVGGSLISSPNVQDKISGGSAQISGDFTLEEAQDLARDLNTGAIPAPVVLSGQYNISASLGAEALNQSLIAGLIGVIALCVWMIAYYKLPGLLATLALVVYSLLIQLAIKVALPTGIAVLIGLGIFIYIVHLILRSSDSSGEKFISFLLSCIILFFVTFVLSTKITMTLAGIAGVILSIGMAVDANILIFERMKEELRNGKDLSTAIREGFDRAWDSIRDSNFSSLITCGILFFFGTSIIRGFALNLALGILISMFSAIMLTRTILLFTASTKLSENLWLWGKPKVAKIKHIKFIKLTKPFFAISGTLVLASIILSLVFGLKLGLDFTGGTMLEVKSASTEMSAATINETLGEEYGAPHVVSTNEGTFIIRLQHLSEEQHDAVNTKLSEKFEGLEEVRFTTVGPVIGETLKQKALVAILLTSLMIVLYIAFAFRKIPRELSPWRFGIAAIIALIHDVMIVIGVFVVLGKVMGVEVDALFITALLTVMGFSVHDTIVVFDRIRENLRFRKEGETLAETTDTALNQTLARSINTSMSVLITTVALLIFGAESIRMFILALTIGIVVGTYSSIFIASMLVVWWKERATNK
jgi:SecD/SecF fusion protein